MRQVGLSDLHHAAWAVHQRPVPEKAAYCARLIWRAHVADKYVKRLAKLHPDWGDGSLRAAVLGCAGPVCAGVNGTELQSGIALVLEALQKRRGADLGQK